MRWVAAVAALGAVVVPSTASAAQAPGAPGAVANWAAGNKDGFGSSTNLAGKAWFTLGGGELTEVYAPDLGTARSPGRLAIALGDSRRLY